MTEIDLRASKQSRELRPVERLLLANAGRSPRDIHVWVSWRKQIREELQRDIEQIERMKVGIADQYADDLQ